jgi:intein/homing endonuclease
MVSCFGGLSWNEVISVEVAGLVLSLPEYAPFIVNDTLPQFVH